MQVIRRSTSVRRIMGSALCLMTAVTALSACKRNASSVKAVHSMPTLALVAKPVSLEEVRKNTECFVALPGRGAVGDFWLVKEQYTDDPYSLWFAQSSLEPRFVVITSKSENVIELKAPTVAGSPFKPDCFTRA
jgi:hypothetical protein